MIISTAWEKQLPDFKQLVKEMDYVLNEDAKRRESYYTKRGGKKLEEDVYNTLSYCAQGTPFEGSIELVSGASFPDIVANKMFGIEVKSTEKDHWQSIGSSILESTRNKDVERIFMTFGKLGKPVEFLSKPYEDCLSEIVVTHYPRYRIDMKLQEKNEPTIFEKMGIEYDVLRRMDNPVPAVSDYYRSTLKEGQSLWWVGGSTEENAAPMTARLWTSLSHLEKEQLTIEGYALFPEILSSSNNKKYNRYALWLATQKGVINTNVRDSFSAGGKIEMQTNGGVIVKMPAAFGRIKKYREQILQTISETDASVLADYWGVDSVSDDRIGQWCDLVAENAQESVGYDIAKSVLKNIFPRYGLYEYPYTQMKVAEKSAFDHDDLHILPGAYVMHPVFGKGRVCSINIAFDNRRPATFPYLVGVDRELNISDNGIDVSHERFGSGKIYSYQIVFKKVSVTLNVDEFKNGTVKLVDE